MDWQRVNEIFRELDLHPDQKKHVNCIRMHPTESHLHFMLKCKFCEILKAQGHDFITEVWTRDRKRRFDVLDLTDNEVIEIETDPKVTKEDADKTIRTERDL